jgi:hypothetical protein
MKPIRNESAASCNGIDVRDERALTGLTVGVVGCDCAVKDERRRVASSRRFTRRGRSLEDLRTQESK